MNNLAFATIKELLQKLESKQISAKELLDFTISRFKKYDEQINSAIEIFEDINLEDNSETSQKLKSIPGLIKDNICQKGRIASAASKILANHVAPYDATAVKKLKSNGAVLVGRANCDEFAMGSSNETSFYGKCYNPWDISRVPGGSSGGSAAAVAAGFVPFALGSETGGSIRQPAAFCGIVGIKPTYGLISRYGLIAYASSLDQIGVFTRTVYDNALVLSTMSGLDANDSTTIDKSSINYVNSLTGKIKPGLKIGIIDNAMTAQGMDSEVSALLEKSILQLEKLGAKVERITVKSMDHAAAVYFIVSRAEAASNLARFDGVRYGFRSKKSQELHELYTNTRQEGFGDTVRTRIMIGNYALSVGHADKFYESAKVVQSMMVQEFKEIFRSYDLLFSPMHPIPAFTVGAFDNNKLAMDLQDYFTCFANLVGAPAISIPCGFTKQNLPVGFQLIGAHFAEELIFQTAHAYEQSTDWHKMHPTGF